MYHLIDMLILTGSPAELVGTTTGCLRLDFATSTSQCVCVCMYVCEGSPKELTTTSIRDKATWIDVGLCDYARLIIYANVSSHSLPARKGTEKLDASCA
jgi:hypothetical protein